MDATRILAMREVFVLLPWRFNQLSPCLQGNAGMKKGLPNTQPFLFKSPQLLCISPSSRASQLVLGNTLAMAESCMPNVLRMTWASTAR